MIAIRPPKSTPLFIQSELGRFHKVTGIYSTVVDANYHCRFINKDDGVITEKDGLIYTANIHDKGIK